MTTRRLINWFLFNYVFLLICLPNNFAYAADFAPKMSLQEAIEFWNIKVGDQLINWASSHTYGWMDDKLKTYIVDGFYHDGTILVTKKKSWDEDIISNSHTSSWVIVKKNQSLKDIRIGAKVYSSKKHYGEVRGFFLDGAFLLKRGDEWYEHVRKVHPVLISPPSNSQEIAVGDLVYDKNKATGKVRGFSADGGVFLSDGRWEKKVWPVLYAAPKFAAGCPD